MSVRAGKARIAPCPAHNVPARAATIRSRADVYLGSAQPLTPNPPELERPPFAALGSLDSVQTADEMVACFKRLGARPDRLAHAHELAISSIGGHAGTGLARAGAAIAHDIDQGVGGGVASGYHNPQHYLEVMLSALYLARLHKLDSERTLRLVTAGLIHDFHHDGSRAGNVQFRLEKLALQKSRPYLNAAGVDAAQCRSLETLVLATEPRVGVPFARACWNRHRGGVGDEAISSTLPRALERLVNDRELAFDAVLLAEADVLPSIGLTLEHAETLQARLASEWGTPLGRADKLQFTDRMISEISVAQYFLPNMRRLRQAYAG